MITLYPHQASALDDTRRFNRVAYYHEMGLGKTFTGAEKIMRLGSKPNLVVCQKSKIDDWVNHFRDNYQEPKVIDLTRNGAPAKFINSLFWDRKVIGVINYELAFRRPELLKLEHFTLMLDESSMIQNERSKRSKFVLNLHPDNVVLLSGTPVGGKYEKLWSQMCLLGWKISKQKFYDQYVNYYYDNSQGFPLMIIKGYKNVERLKEKMRLYGCHFLKTEDVMELPDQVEQKIMIPASKEYRKFEKTSVVEVDGRELVGDSTLSELLYKRQLCGHLNKEKLNAFRDILESTGDRLIVFYNFNAELDALVKITRQYTNHISIVNGEKKDMRAYERYGDSVTFIQYQAGAMGLNLQKANKIVYFTLTQWSELFEQSKKRTHRIGQERPCFYYYLMCRGSIEERIFKTLKMRRDYTDALYEMEGRR